MVDTAVQYWKPLRTWSVGFDADEFSAMPRCKWGGADPWPSGHHGVRRSRWRWLAAALPLASRLLIVAVDSTILLARRNCGGLLVALGWWCSGSRVGYVLVKLPREPRVKPVRGMCHADQTHGGHSEKVRDRAGLQSRRNWPARGVCCQSITENGHWRRDRGLDPGRRRDAAGSLPASRLSFALGRAGSAPGLHRGCCAGRCRRGSWHYAARGAASGRGLQVAGATSWVGW